MVGQQPLNEDSPAVQKHLDIMQSVITRMATNSRACKVGCVILVTAALVSAALTGKPEHAMIALVPTTLFLFLDYYYLALEQAFRRSYNEFVDKLHRGELSPEDVYQVRPSSMGTRLVMQCLGSVSIWLFYPLVTGTIMLAWLLTIA